MSGHNAYASSRPIPNICALSLALPPSRTQELQNLEDNQHKNASAKRQREIVHVQRSKPEEIPCNRPKKRQAQHRRDGKEDQCEHRIWSVESRDQRCAEGAVDEVMRGSDTAARDAETAKGLTLDEVRRIAANIVKLPALLGKTNSSLRIGEIEES